MEKTKPKKVLKTGRRLKYGEPTKNIRVPVSLVEKCKLWIMEQMRCKA